MKAYYSSSIDNERLSNNTSLSARDSYQIDKAQMYYASVRAVGSRPNNQTEESPKQVFQSGPILHSKYLIISYWKGPGHRFKSIGAFTGSMNLTEKARQNQENVVWIESEAVGDCFFSDYVRSFLVSRRLRRQKN